jgi:hypothetical protein
MQQPNNLISRVTRARSESVHVATSIADGGATALWKTTGPSVPTASGRHRKVTELSLSTPSCRMDPPLAAVETLKPGRSEGRVA